VLIISIKRSITLTSIYARLKKYSLGQLALNTVTMTPLTPDQLVDLGNQFRAQLQPEQSLECYAQALTQDRKQISAFNNYGNVLREIGDPEGAIPFLQRAIVLKPDFVTAKFNLAVAQLLAGDYAQGWANYESRWNYEHLAGTLPTFNQPRWAGQDLSGKTILVIGEQGHGDTIQFARFLYDLRNRGAIVLLQVTEGLVPIMADMGVAHKVSTYGVDIGDFDCWTPIMSLPLYLEITLQNLPRPLGYLRTNTKLSTAWTQDLGLKRKMRVGIAWSGRRDSWLNQHKGVPFDQICQFLSANSNYDWINLQADCTEEEQQALDKLGVRSFPGKINNFADTAALMSSMDHVVSVDTAVAHLAAALGKPTFIMLNNFAVDWRWLLNRKDSPWYPSALLFRQPSIGDWRSVFDQVTKQLSLAKI
jgi:hypothetical protein